MTNQLPNLATIVMVVLAVIFLGCEGEPEEEENRYWIDAVISYEIPTVATVTWDATTDDLYAAHLDVWDYVGRSLPPVPATRDGDVFTAIVLGLKPGAEYGVRAVEEHDEGWLFSESAFVTTGNPPGVLPHIEVSGTGDHGGGFIATSTVSFPSLPIIVDREGECVWWHELEPPEGGDWETFYIPRVALARDGSSVYYEVASGVAYENRERIIVRVSIDGSHVEMLPLEGAHHDFAELPDGTLAVLVEDVRSVEGELVAGDQIVEVGESGEEISVWSIWDHEQFDSLEDYDPESGWTHANAIQYEELDDTYHVSMRNLDAVYKIDRGSGDVIRIVGGEDSDFVTPVGGTDFFERQHRFRVLEDGLLVFDNRVVEEGSRVVQLSLDTDTGEAETVWEYTLEPAAFSLGFGDVERLPGGNTLVDWSALGQIDEVTFDGEIIWQLNASVGSGFGYMEWFESFYGQ